MSTTGGPAGRSVRPGQNSDDGTQWIIGPPQNDFPCYTFNQLLILCQEKIIKRNSRVVPKYLKLDVKNITEKSFSH
jgi:hypothetical protein